MADIVKRRTEKNDVSHYGAVAPLRSLWALLGGEPVRDLERLRWEQDRAYVPRFDIKETKDAYVFKADLPGLREENVEVSLVGNRLTVTGQRDPEPEQPGETIFAAERPLGAFARSFILPDSADGEKIQAGMTDGVLTISVPKRPEAQPKKIVLGKPSPSA